MIPPALQRWRDQKDDLLAGRTPRAKHGGLTVAELANHFLTAKKRLLENDELAERTFRDCYKVCERIVTTFGRQRQVSDLVSGDFAALRVELAKTLGPVALGIEIQRVRSLFKYGYEKGLIDQQVRYGTALQKPSRKTLRKERQKIGDRMLEAADLRKIIDAVSQPMKSMTLLGINCGLGNRDIALMPISAADFETGWLDYPRPKTAVERRCPLWQETLDSLRSWMGMRPEPADQSLNELMFITHRGGCWVKHSNGNKGAWSDSVGLEFGKLLRKVALKRLGLSFYGLRHTFRTAADEALDQPAMELIMGHAPSSTDMAAVYRGRISDERLIAVTKTVQTWLFGTRVANQ